MINQISDEVVIFFNCVYQWCLRKAGSKEELLGLLFCLGCFEILHYFRIRQKFVKRFQITDCHFSNSYIHSYSTTSNLPFSIFHKSLPPKRWKAFNLCTYLIALRSISIARKTRLIQQLLFEPIFSTF